MKRAENAGIPGEILVPKHFESRAVFNEKLLELIQSYKVDAVILAGCLLTIPESMVKAFPNRIINIHPSLIPAFCGKEYYGLKVHEGVLGRGSKVTGATVHFVDNGLDTGPIILQKAVSVKEGWELLPKAIDLLANGKLKVVDNHVHIEE